MYYDRFDIVEAWYLALAHCHGGQWSPEYARLCRMARYFKPSPLMDYDSLTDNGKDIYNAACTKLLTK